MAAKSPKRPAVPAAMRYEIWKRDMGNVLEGKCPVAWCTATIEFKDFVLAHNTPFSKGGATDAKNLRVACASCNLGMGNRYTVDEWSAMGAAVVGRAAPAAPAAQVAPPPPGCWCCA